MNKIVNRANNKGFSLIELVVIIAIMALSIAAVSLSVSLVTGAEAKKAFEKIEASLDETKTGAMSRFDETMAIKFLTANAAINPAVGVTGDRAKDGFYVIKEMTTLTSDTTEDVDHPKPSTTILGTEQVYLADKRVELKITYKDASGTPVEKVISAAGGEVTFSFDRATGLYKEVKGKDATGTDFNGVPVSLTATSGMKTYKMEFVAETGKHIRVDM